MYLYVIENVDTGLVKIGYSADPRRRCAGLQTGSSSQLRVAYTASVAADRARLLEQQLHSDQRHRRVRGEWFNLSVTEAQQQIDHVIIRWGDDPLLGVV